MRYSVSYSRPTIVGRILFSALICLPLESGWAARTLAAPPPNQATVISEKPDPDTLLIAVYEALSANRLKEAQAQADKLVSIYPNFRLGHLIRGDLLMMHTSAVRTFGALKNAPDEKLKDLREEALMRLKSLRKRPPLDFMPRSVLQLMDQQKNVLVVDAKNSRLYVYEKYGQHLQLRADYYVTHGKLGTHKTKEGDQKTPIGIYYITSHLVKSQLSDFYGAGALPINYPNDWDKMNGRKGSGIWLHGTPADNYSRPPLASDGCVVLTNPDMEQLFTSVQIGRTPVVISDQVEFISKAKWQLERDAAVKMIDKWHHDAESNETVRLSTNYSKKFKSELGDDLKAWLAKNQESLFGSNGRTSKLRDVTLFRYPGHDELIVGTFMQEIAIGKTKKLIRKRQYWSKEGLQWKIIYESNL